jgi:hypothetical protein
MRMMFSSPQWVDGKPVQQAETSLDHVMAYRAGELIVNVKAADLMILTAEDLPATYLDALRAVLPQAHQPWTAADEAALREMWDQGVPVSDMVSRLGRRYGAIKERARRLGLSSRGRLDRT